MENILKDDWRSINSYIIYGFGQVGKKYIDIFRKRFEVSFIVDNSEKQEKMYKEIPIITQSEMIAKRKNNEKIIIFAAKEACLSICNSLNKIGLHENVDYCKLDVFIKEWYWQFEHNNYIREVHMSINTDCTFNCEKCNMFMPYYKEKMQYKLENIKENLQLFFNVIDYVYVFSLLGGEPFLNGDLKDIVKYIGENYKLQIGRLEIITNGSLIPNNETLFVLQQHKVLVRISDYTKQIKYEKQLEKLIKKLEEYNVSYVIEQSLTWLDFRFPSDNLKIKLNDIRSHMMCCAPAFHGLNDKKFYYCHVAWSAEKAGLFQLKEGDYISLESIDANNKDECRYLIEYASGNMKNNYVSLCEVCMGCGADNNYTVTVAKQKDK